MKFVQVYFKLLNYIEYTILVLGLAAMLSITFANIIGRKLLDASWSFTEEVTCALFLLVTLVGAAAAARRGAHLGLSIVTDLLPKNMQKAVIVFGCLVSVTFSILLAVFGVEMVLGEIEYNMRTASLGWPEWWFGMFVPVGGVLMALEFLNCAAIVIMQPAQAGDN